MCTTFAAEPYYAKFIPKRRPRPSGSCEEFITFFWLEGAVYGGGQYFTSLVALRRGLYLLANSSNARAAFYSPL
jgi:hypothetical protein